MVDMAHYAGLIAAGVYPSPVGIADYVTSTTHKTLRGPRGGFILMKEEHAKAINSAVFPGLQGGPLMHVIAAKAVAFGEALTRDFKVYQERVLENARVLAKVLQERGVRIVSGGTDSHMFLVDLRAKQVTGKEAEAALARAHITVNKNAIPNDPEKPFVTSGIRIGSPAVDDARIRRDRVRGARAPDRRRPRRAGGRGRDDAHTKRGCRDDAQVPGVQGVMGRRKRCAPASADRRPIADVRRLPAT